MIEKPAQKSAPADGLPLFYREPQALNSAIHAAWRLKPGDFAFAADAPWVPLVAGEMIAASRDYPVVFASDTAAPIAVLGLDRSNLFIADGQWEADHYVPAYVRRFPFGYAGTGDADRFVLTLDAASERIARTDDAGEALFEEGKPSAFTLGALQLCEAFQGEITATRALCTALKDQNLLIDRHAMARLPDGRSYGLQGFQVIDAERLRNLESAILADWHRSGWLAILYAQLGSLERFHSVMNRQGGCSNAAVVG